MKKEIDIFGWKYKPSIKEMTVIQSIMVLTVMCLIITKGVRSPFAYKIYSGICIVGGLIFSAKKFFY